MKRTVLFEEYKNYPNVKLIDFGGWELPLHFAAGIIAEHHAVRNAVGLFDISHMGECLISGPSATDYLDYLVTNDVSTMVDGQIIYTLMCYPNGTVVDDLILYRINEQSYWVVMNAANVAKDLAWMKTDNPRALSGKAVARIVDYSETTSQMALQGPLAEKIMEKLAPEAAKLGFFRFIAEINIAGVTALVSRNGYTGEDGFELYCPNQDAIVLWKTLLEAGSEFGIVPCGLGARDTLRLEAKLPLYGHEISDTITPLEANLGAFVKLEKSEFCGREALVAQEAQGIARSVRGFEMIDAAVPRNGYRVFLGESDIGYVTSGTKSPTLNIFCGYAIIERKTNLKFGDEIEIEIHGKRKRAKLVRTPFYKRSPKRS